MYNPNPFIPHPDGPWEAMHRAEVEENIRQALSQYRCNLISEDLFRDDKDVRGAKRWIWWQHHPDDEVWKRLGRPFWSVAAYQSWHKAYFDTSLEERFYQRGPKKGHPHHCTFPTERTHGDSGLRHSHVVPQKVILDWLLEGTDDVAVILNHNIGAVLTISEARQLPNYKNSDIYRSDPWSRYAGTAIRFIDNPDWTAEMKEGLLRHGLVASPSV